MTGALIVIGIILFIVTAIAVSCTDGNHCATLVGTIGLILFLAIHLYSVGNPCWIKNTQNGIYKKESTFIVDGKKYIAVTNLDTKDVIVVYVPTGTENSEYYRFKTSLPYIEPFKFTKDELTHEE